jgi:hypothetical protein
LDGGGNNGQPALRRTAPVDALDAAHQHRTQSAISSRAHYILASRAERTQRILGILVVSLGSVSAGFAFADPGRTLTYAIGTFSTLAVICAGLQALWAQTPMRHREAGRQYASIRRQLDLLVLGSDVSKEELKVVFKSLDQAANSTPIISDRAYVIARDEFLTGRPGARERLARRLRFGRLTPPTDT